MKYIILVGDGMGDYPIESLGNKTPLEYAKTPNMDFLAKNGKLGLVRTIPEGLSPASDVANLAIFGYDPKVYYSGRAPFEAANLGVALKDDEVAFRCNLITASPDKLIDYSAGHISTKEAKVLIEFLDEKLGTSELKFYPGVSYRHLAVFKTKGLKARCVPPHDITGREFKKYLPKGPDAQFLVSLMQESVKILAEHEVNQVRIDLKENPANMIWLWGQGKRPSLVSFKDKYGLSGSVISAVDLIKGIGRVAGLEVLNVKGATGYYDTNYQGKAEAAIASLKTKDLVYLHVEAPDEASHNGNMREKILAIERFDQLVVGTILEALKKKGDFRILLLPDHATPLALRTHTADSICFAMYGKGISPCGLEGFNEAQAKKSGIFLDQAHILMDRLVKEQEI
ncbi:MAG: cofactor-independent phosphoglycerate mutase [Candidatus Omnitrophota bacterium]